MHQLPASSPIIPYLPRNLPVHHQAWIFHHPFVGFVHLPAKAQLHLPRHGPRHQRAKHCMRLQIHCPLKLFAYGSCFQERLLPLPAEIDSYLLRMPCSALHRWHLHINVLSSRVRASCGLFSLWFSICGYSLVVSLYIILGLFL